MVIIIAALLVVSLVIGLTLLLRQGAKQHARTQAELDAINALPDDEARNLALRLLSRPELFESKPASGEPPTVDLPPSVLDLLSQYDEVVRGEFRIGRTALSQPPTLRGYIKLGTDALDAEILAREGDSRVFMAYGDQAPSEGPEIERSIWHVIIQASGESVIRAG